MTLPDFLLARIAEDEKMARAATHPQCFEVQGWAWWDPQFGYHLFEAGEFESNAHMPARVLAECEAKRRIVAFCDPTNARPGGGRYVAKRVLFLMALPYADHEDYRQEWKPGD